MPLHDHHQWRTMITNLAGEISSSRHTHCNVQTITVTIEFTWVKSFYLSHCIHSSFVQSHLKISYHFYQLLLNSRGRSHRPGKTVLKDNILQLQSFREKSSGELQQECAMQCLWKTWGLPSWVIDWFLGLRKLKEKVWPDKGQWSASQGPNQSMASLFTDLIKGRA